MGDKPPEPLGTRPRHGVWHPPPTPPRPGNPPRKPRARQRPGPTHQNPARSTRWHGTTIGIGLWPSAVPAARKARGLPARAATSP